MIIKIILKLIQVQIEYNRIYKNVRIIRESPTAVNNIVRVWSMAGNDIVSKQMEKVNIGRNKME